MPTGSREGSISCSVFFFFLSFFSAPTIAAKSNRWFQCSFTSPASGKLKATKEKKNNDQESSRGEKKSARKEFAIIAVWIAIAATGTLVLYCYPSKLHSD